MDDFEPETVRASRSRLAVRVTVFVGLVAILWGAVYAWGGLILALLAGLGCWFNLAVLVLAAGAWSATWLMLAARDLYDFVFPHRLELDREALRFVRAGPFGEVVKAHIPYRNLARVTASKIKKALPLALSLHDPDDPDTHIASAEGQRRVAAGVTYRLPGGWEVATGEVAERLRRRCPTLIP